MPSDLIEAVFRKQTIAMKIIRRYSELIRLPSYDERFEYLRIGGAIGESTFGFDRYLNQTFYTSKEWRSIRRNVIVRDNGCDMAHPDYSIGNRIVIHHLNPITIEDIESGNPEILNPDFLVCVSDLTHKAIHFGDSELLPKPLIERKPFDTCPWKG